jgi:glucose 1-dehydrogenase
MKAIAVKPGIPNTVHLTELPARNVGDVPNGRGVLVRVLRVVSMEPTKRSMLPSMARRLPDMTS